MRKLEVGILGISVTLLFITGYCICKSLCIGPIGDMYRQASMTITVLQIFVTIGMFIVCGKE
jgi:hypothetical protein|nr:MAG TPA: hypothetical protein [Caudoviricetes sp.]